MSDFFHINWIALNWVDYAIMVVLLLSMVVSFMRGLIRESISLLVWVVAFVVSVLYAPKLALHFSSIQSNPMRFALAFIIIFFAILVGGMVLNILIGVLVRKSGIGLLDRLLGVLFGLVRGVLLIAVMLMLVGVTGVGMKGLKQSQFVPVFHPLVKWISTYIPDKLDAVKAWKPIQHPNQSKGQI